MALFDDQFAILSAQLQAALAVIAQYPDVAQEVRAAVNAAQPSDTTDSEAQDDARANVLINLISDFNTALE